MNADLLDVGSIADRLVEAIRSYGRVAVAFSGGVDSTTVAKAAQLALGDNAVAVTGVSASLAEGQLEMAQSIAQLIGIRHLVIETSEFSNPDYLRNDGVRCYHCKSTLYDQMLAMRESLGTDVIASGANLDDLGDYRPGLVAAAERRVRHPLQEVGLNKRMVRALARHWGLPNWEAPATPCLSSRLAVGVEVTPERTRRIDQAERFLRVLGFRDVRVRFHPGDHARIEVAAAEVARLADPEIRDLVVKELKSLGFKFISLDLEGFRSGALNVLIPEASLRAAVDGAH